MMEDQTPEKSKKQQKIRMGNAEPPCHPPQETLWFCSQLKKAQLQKIIARHRQSRSRRNVILRQLTVVVIWSVKPKINNRLRCTAVLHADQKPNITAKPSERAIFWAQNLHNFSWWRLFNFVSTPKKNSRPAVRQMTTVAKVDEPDARRWQCITFTAAESARCYERCLWWWQQAVTRTECIA